MEKPLHYSILKMNREISKSDFNTWRSSVNDLWEEKAFAEDASGNYNGGCIWPPRSYSCSFCKREFRSAQALGGHMNVHRRDRARLKQSDLSPENQTQYFDSNLRDEMDGVCDVANPNSSTFGYRVSSFSVQEKLSDNSKQVVELMKNQREEICEHLVETDLLVGLNSGPCCKRAKKTGVSGVSLLIKKPRLCVKEVSTEEAVSSSMKDIDLELRLG